jgi:hypothetical protein
VGKLVPDFFLEPTIIIIKETRMCYLECLDVLIIIIFCFTPIVWCIVAVLISNIEIQNYILPLIEF